MSSVAGLIILVALLGFSGFLALGGPPASAAGSVLAMLALAIAANIGPMETAAVDMAWIAAQSLLPASICHLALVFPREPRIAKRSNAIACAAYALAASLASIEWTLISRQDRLWELVDRFSATWLLLATIWLGASSYLAFKESTSARERAAARALLASAAVVAGGLFALAMGMGASLPLGPRRTIAASAAVALGALSLVGAHHANLDTRTVLRGTVSYLAYTAAVTSLGYISALVARSGWGWTLPQPDPVILASAVFVALLGLDRLRESTSWLAERSVTPWAPRLRILRSETSARISSAGDADRIMSALVHGLDQGLRPSRVTGFLRIGAREWRLAATNAAPPYESGLARTAEELLIVECGRTARELAVVDLRGLLGQRRTHVRSLRSEGVAIVCAARAGDELRGLALLSGAGSNWDLSSDLRDFAHLLCTRAAQAIARAESAQEQLINTRMAAIGHSASGLAHDLGRPLGEIFLSARSSTGAAFDKVTVRSLAQECMDLLERFVDESKTGRWAPGGSARLDLVIQASVDRMARLYGGTKPVLRLAPRLPSVADAKSVQRAVENLLENALQWTRTNAQVEVSASFDGRVAVVRIVDRGPGLSPEVARRAFEPFFSTRASTGMGLTIVRDIAGHLGGSVELAPAIGDGTEAILKLPVDGSA